MGGAQVPEGGALMSGINTFLKETLLPCKDTVGSLQRDKSPLLVHAVPRSRSSRLQKCEKYICVVYAPPSLQDFVTATRTDRGLSKREVHIDSWLRNII